MTTKPRGLSACLRDIPPDEPLRATLSGGDTRTAAEWLAHSDTRPQDQTPHYVVKKINTDYGRKWRWWVYSPGAGGIFSGVNEYPVGKP